ncbi:DUF2789 domain-containing protein [Aliiglaciecola sp.]|nr:DUF2789 domain-containing protein [Aliiglaciecola sp.]
MIAENLTLNDLFLQLGLHNQEPDIDNFIEQHKGLESSVKLQNAPFWTSQQSEFIANALLDDAEWAELIDQLNSRLR